VTLLASNRHGSSSPASYFAKWQGARDSFKPRLFVLAIGVSDYRDSGYRLDFAAKDARDFAAAIKQQKGGLYREVQVRVLPDDEASKGAILDGFDWLARQTGKRDVAMLFISGHGKRDARGKYRFLPWDYDPTRERRTTITDADLFDFLGSVPGKIVAFLDTCYAGAGKQTKGAAQPDVDRLANQLADAERGVIVFASSTGKQYSLEDEAWQNGAFTKALAEGIRGQADLTADWFVSLAELEAFVSDRVQELTDGRQTPVVTKPEAVQDFKMIHVVQGN